MSADNWEYCPRCMQVKEQEWDKLRKGLEKKYGKVPAGEWIQERATIDKRIESEKKGIEQTLREDYELGLGSDGQFYVSYSGHCKNCGLSHQFKYTGPFGDYQPKGTA